MATKSFFLGSDNSMGEFEDIANQEIVTGMRDDFDLNSFANVEDEDGNIRRLHKEDLRINYEMLRLNSIVIKNASLHGKVVAIKETEGLRDESKSEEMMREMRIMSQLDHPNVIKFYGAIFEKSKNPQIVLELMDRNLFEIITKSRLSLYERMLLAREACKGMQYLEQMRIFHGDYKTENVLYDIASKSVKIADFGFSQKMSHVDNRVDVIRGTPWYLAPEVFLEKRFGSYSDVYSFGISLVVHVTKSLPYDLDFLNTNEFLNRVAPPVMLRPVLPFNEGDCPKSLKDLMHRCWHPMTSARPTFAQILRELDNILVDCLFTTNQSARLFWKHFFVVPNQGLLQEVSESHFADALLKCHFAPHKVEEAKRVFSKDGSVNILHFEKYVDLFF